MLETIKLKLLKLLLNNIFKYDPRECREKFLETTLDDVTYLLKNVQSIQSIFFQYLEHHLLVQVFL